MIKIFNPGYFLTGANSVKIQHCKAGHTHPLIQEHSANCLVQTDMQNMPLTSMCRNILNIVWYSCYPWTFLEMQGQGHKAYKHLLSHLITASSIYMGKKYNKKGCFIHAAKAHGQEHCSGIV